MSAKVFGAGWNFANHFVLENEQEKIPIFQRLPQFENLDVHSIIASREIVLILTSRGEVYQSGFQFCENGDKIEKCTNFVKISFPLGVSITKVCISSYTCVALSSAGNVYFWGKKPSTLEFIDDNNTNGTTVNNHDNPEFLFNTPLRLKTAEKIKKIFGSTLGLLFLSVTNRLYISSTRITPISTISKHVQLFDNVPSAISKITANTSTALVILEDGSVYGTGASTYGELGEIVVAADFIKLNFPKPIKKIKSGYNHNVYLAKDGTVYVSGFNTFFQMGLKNQVDVKQLLEHPYFASNNIKIKDVQTGASHCLYVAEKDVIYASGYNGTYIYL